MKTTVTARLAFALSAALVLYVFCWSSGPREHTHVAFDVSADGRSVVFSPADGVDGLYVLDLRAGTVRQLTSARGITTAPSYSPDGKRIVFALAAGRDEPFHLFVYSFETGRLSQLTNDLSASDLDPSYSSDGSRIVFARANRLRPYSTGGLTWDDWDVATIGGDGAGFRRLTNQHYRELYSPTFAAKDTEVVYSASSLDGGVTSTLFRISLESARPPTSYLPAATEHACGSRGTDPHVSRDGRGLVFIADGQRCYAYDVYVAREGAPDVHPLDVTSMSSYNENPVIVPGTGQIMYLAGTEQARGGRSRYSLYSVDPDSGNLRQVAGPKLFDDPLHWRRK